MSDRPTPEPPTAAEVGAFRALVYHPDTLSISQRMARQAADWLTALDAARAATPAPALREALEKYEQREKRLDVLTPLQREVEPPPMCAGCKRPISNLTGLYRCAQCHAAFDVGCIQEHFNWSVNQNPHAPTPASVRLLNLGYYFGETYIDDPVTPRSCWLRSDGAGTSVPVSDEVAEVLAALVGEPA